MKRGLVVVVCLVLVLSLLFVSVPWFSDLLGKITGKTTLVQCEEGAISEEGCLCQNIKKTSGYCCYSYFSNGLVWNSIPCTRTCQAIEGVCCSGGISDCVGSWSNQWTTDCQGYACCLGTCAGDCYGPGCTEDLESNESTTNTTTTNQTTPTPQQDQTPDDQSEESQEIIDDEENIFEKIINWFKNLFS